MKKTLSKIKNKLLRYYKKSTAQNNTDSERITALRNAGKSDFERWSKDQVFHDNWNERSYILGSYVKDGSHVIEFGAGKGVLKNYFNSTITYQPVDIVKRTSEFLVCDLNKTPLTISLSPYNTAIFSGVLEYVYDIDILFKTFAPEIKHIILSYACSDICKQDRLNNGWLSDYSLSDLKAIFKKNEFIIKNEQSWKDQKLFNLIKDKT